MNVYRVKFVVQPRESDNAYTDQRTLTAADAESAIKKIRAKHSKQKLSVVEVVVLATLDLQ